MMIFISSSGLTLIVRQCYMISHLSFSIPLHLRKSTRWSSISIHSFNDELIHQLFILRSLFAWMHSLGGTPSMSFIDWIDSLSFWVVLSVKGFYTLLFVSFPFPFLIKVLLIKKETSSILYWLPLYDSFLFWLIKLLLPIKIVFLCQLLIKNVWLKNYVWHVDHL